jgi:protein TonB
MPPAAPAGEGPPGENAGGGAAFAGEAGEAVPPGPFRRAMMSEADYTALVMRRLEEKKIYPLSMRKRGIAGDAAVYFTIRPDGSLGSLRAGEGPAHPFLVQAALETVRSAAPFPLMEGRGEEYSIRVTIQFRLE